jgi:hypothetical protein
VSTSVIYYSGAYLLAELTGDTSGHQWLLRTATLAQTSDIPTVPTTVSSFTNDANYASVQIVRW